MPTDRYYVHEASGETTWDRPSAEAGEGYEYDASVGETASDITGTSATSATSEGSMAQVDRDLEQILEQVRGRPLRSDPTLRRRAAPPPPAQPPLPPPSPSPPRSPRRTR